MRDALSQYRKELDEIDEQLIEILARRFLVCKDVATHKAQTGIPMMQHGRVAEVKEKAAGRASRLGIREQFAVDLYELIISEACRLEEDIIRNFPKSD